jgi:hypothetical protein
MERCRITIGFSAHHVETIPLMGALMERHGTIVLEEPPVPHFEDMLKDRIPVDAYLAETDSEFPEFDRHLCHLLRKLHNRGLGILQVEPYLERLLAIHELLADGATIRQVLATSALAAVYRAERNATAALIAYYNASVRAPFDQVIEAVKDFARVDAVRLGLREELRAEAIATLAQEHHSLFVEAGYIHFPLFRMLQRLLKERAHIGVVHVRSPLIRPLRGRRRNLGPGDVLTLRYAIHGRVPEAAADLLAARSLIYVKLIAKEELLPGDSPAPHTADEVRVNRFVDGLSLEDCRRIFARIRLVGRERAWQLAAMPST